MFAKRIISQESRAFRRARAFGIIKYSVAGDPEHKKVLANPRSISAGGALFIADKKFIKGTVIDLELYLPPLKGFFNVVSSVVDSSRIGNLEEYWIRIKFTAINPEDRRTINNYIEGMAKDPEMAKYLDKSGASFKRRLK